MRMQDPDLGKTRQYPDATDILGKMVEDVSVGSAEPLSNGNTKTESIERFLEVFERSAKRWEMVVYPALFAFILLAGYGFYLVYSLTNDMKMIAQNLDPQMGVHMTDFSESLKHMTENVEVMASSVNAMSDDVSVMSSKMDYLSHMPTISNQMTSINHSMQTMTVNMDWMRRDMGQLNHSVSKPMSTINKFMPW